MKFALILALWLIAVIAHYTGLIEHPAYFWTLGMLTGVFVAS